MDPVTGGIWLLLGVIGVALGCGYSVAKKREDIVALLAVILAIMAVCGGVVTLSAAFQEGKAEYQGTPVDSLETGETYTVLSITNQTREEVFLGLSTESEKLWYVTPSEELPKGLKVNDDITMLKDGQLAIL